jgi:hypothetical protein
MHSRPIWPLLALVTLASLALSLARYTGQPVWPAEVLAFAFRWAFIAAFAMFGRAIFRRT